MKHVSDLTEEERANARCAQCGSSLTDDCPVSEAPNSTNGKAFCSALCIVDYRVENGWAD